jgi:hypothetical protein
MPRNCKRKKYGLEDRFDEDICTKPNGGQIIVIATQIS